MHTQGELLASRSTSIYLFDLRRFFDFGEAELSVRTRSYDCDEVPSTFHTSYWSLILIVIAIRSFGLKCRALIFVGTLVPRLDRCSRSKSLG